MATFSDTAEKMFENLKSDYSLSETEASEILSNINNLTNLIHEIKIKELYMFNGNLKIVAAKNKHILDMRP